MSVLVTIFDSNEYSTALYTIPLGRIPSAVLTAMREQNLGYPHWTTSLDDLEQWHLQPGMPLCSPITITETLHYQYGS